MAFDKGVLLAGCVWPHYPFRTGSPINATFSDRLTIHLQVSLNSYNCFRVVEYERSILGLNLASKEVVMGVKTCDFSRSLGPELA